MPLVLSFKMQVGVYDTSSIVAGTYKITFSRDGFSKLVRSSITVVVGNTTVNAQLKVGAVTDSVVVTTDIPLLRTEDGVQSTTLSSQALTDLPQVGKGPDWSSFVILLPGSAGASNTNGMAAQGVIGTGTSNGGDAFHGSAYEYWQNDALNAANYTFPGQPTQGKSVLRFNNYGGSVGGPILKKRLFFFFDYDKIIDNGGNQPVAYTIPTTAVMGGDFTGYPTLYDPATTQVIPTGTYTFSDGTKQTCPCVTRESFAAEYGNGNKIPTNRIDSVANAIQAYFPGGSASTGYLGKLSAGVLQSNGLTVNNYTYTSTAGNPFTRYFGRLDFDVTPSNRITLSETEGDNPGVSFGAGICPVNCRTGDVSRNNAQITDVWTITSHLTNELRLGYTNQLNFFVPGTLDKGYPAKLGWQFAKRITSRASISRVGMTITLPMAM